MGCCGSPSQPRAKYELTTPDGKTRVFLSRTEATVARTSAGGGAIRVVR